MRNIALISRKLLPDQQPDFILDRRAPDADYYDSVNGTELAIKYHFTTADKKKWHEYHIWPKKITQEGIEWEYLSHGTFNVAYRSKDGTHVLKIPRCTDTKTDTPIRAVRLWNELNPTLPAKITQDGRGWIAPYIEGTEPTQSEVISKLIDIYWTTKRIVVDASSYISGRTLGNFKKMTLENGSHRIVCIDPGAALLLTQEKFSRSQTSLDFWKDSQACYDPFLARTERPEINHLIKALLYIDRHFPDYRVQLLETPQYAFRIKQFSKAYDAERQSQKTSDTQIPYQHYEFFTSTELASRDPYAKKLVEKGYYGKLFQLLFREPAFFNESELISFKQYPQDEIATVLEKIRPQLLALIRRNLTSFESREAADAYWHKLLNGEDIVKACGSTKSAFFWHERLFDNLNLFGSDKNEAREIVSICSKGRNTLSEEQEATLKKGYIGPALTLLLSAIRENESASNAPQSQMNGPRFFTAPECTSDIKAPSDIQLETADSLKSFLSEKLTLSETTPLTKSYNHILKALLNDVMWNHAGKLSELDKTSFKELMDFIQFSFPLSSCEAAKKAIVALALAPSKTPYSEMLVAPCEFRPIF